MQPTDSQTGDPLDLAGQDREQAEAANRAQLSQQIEIADIKWLMANRQGRRFVANLLAQAGVYRLTFNTDALVMAFNEGARNIGLRLLAEVTAHCPQNYIEMLKERSVWPQK